MPALTPDRIASLLAPFYPDPGALLLSQLSTYLDLLLKWNARINLTSIREPEHIVTRHFGESLFTARHLPPCSTLLDLGSGAGFPGLPIQLALPHLRVTLAEAQHKKAAFLREVIRTLHLPTVVWPGRAEDLPAGLLYDVVTLRAVDRPQGALSAARDRLALGGVIAHLAGAVSHPSLSIPIPTSIHTFLHLLQ